MQTEERTRRQTERGYAQRDPKQEYKREGFELFEDLLFCIRENTMKALTP